VNPYEAYLADLKHQREVVQRANVAQAAAKAWADEQREKLYDMLDRYPQQGPLGPRCTCAGVYSQYWDGNGYGELYESGRDRNKDCLIHGDNPVSFNAPAIRLGLH
jgi:uncharacterized protein with PIN domain